MNLVIYNFVCLFECIKLTMYSVVRLLVLLIKEYNYLLLNYCVRLLESGS